MDAPLGRDPEQVHPAPDVVSITEAGRTVLLDARAGRYYALDGAGGRIWELLTARETLPTIETRLASEFDAPRERIALDLRRLIQDLRSKGLVT